MTPTNAHTMAKAFDQAFRPSDKQIAALDALFGIVERVNILHESADLNIGGETYAVHPNLCRVCGAASDEDCVHKAITRQAVDYARELDGLDYQEHAQDQADARAVAVGVG